MQGDGWGSKAQRDGLAHGWLDSVISAFETAKADNTGFNILAAEAAGDAARVLGFPDLDRRIDTLLAGVTLGDKLAGVLTNVDVSARLNEPLPRHDRHEAEARYPAFDMTTVRESVATFGPTANVCRDKTYEQAFAMAATEEERMSIAVAQAVLGDVGDLETADRLLTSQSGENLNTTALVLAIEFYRRGQVAEAEAVQAHLYDSCWTPITLALGVCGRTPWPLYPYN